MFQIQMLVDAKWVMASSHTSQADADAQMARFIAAGTDPANLKIVQE